MKTRIYKSYEEFIFRENKDENGVSELFASNNPNWEEMNDLNKSCYNCNDCNNCYNCNDCNYCYNCNDCNNCYYCNYCYNCNNCNNCDRIFYGKDVEKGDLVCCLGLVYKYVCIPRINKGVQKIQLGCFLRTRDEWENDFWNNDSEFPEGTKESDKRVLAFKMACMWLDAQVEMQEK